MQRGDLMGRGQAALLVVLLACEPPVDTGATAAEAVALLQSSDVEDCGKAEVLLSAALDSDPDWAEGYFLRSGAQLCIAGPLASAAAVGRRGPDAERNAAADRLEAASHDLATYVRLAPEAADRDRATSAAVEMQRRAAAVRTP